MTHQSFWELRSSYFTTAQVHLCSVWQHFWNVPLDLPADSHGDQWGGLFLLRVVMTVFPNKNDTKICQNVVYKNMFSWCVWDQFAHHKLLQRKLWLYKVLLYNFDFYPLWPGKTRHRCIKAVSNVHWIKFGSKIDVPRKKHPYNNLQTYYEIMTHDYTWCVLMRNKWCVDVDHQDIEPTLSQADEAGGFLRCFKQASNHCRCPCCVKKWGNWHRSGCGWVDRGFSWHYCFIQTLQGTTIAFNPKSDPVKWIFGVIAHMLKCIQLNLWKKLFHSTVATSKEMLMHRKVLEQCLEASFLRRNGRFNVLRFSELIQWKMKQILNRTV